MKKLVLFFSIHAVFSGLDAQKSRKNKYDSVSVNRFSLGKAFVKQNGSSFFINKKGEKVSY